MIFVNWHFKLYCNYTCPLCMYTAQMKMRMHTYGYKCTHVTYLVIDPHKWLRSLWMESGFTSMPSNLINHPHWHNNSIKAFCTVHISMAIYILHSTCVTNTISTEYWLYWACAACSVHTTYMLLTPTQWHGQNSNCQHMAYHTLLSIYLLQHQ